MDGGAGGLGQSVTGGGSSRGAGKGTMGGRGGGDGYKQDGNPPMRSGSEESLCGKRRRQGSSQSLSHVAPPTNGGGADSSNRSVGSEGSNTTSQAARNKKRFVWPDDLHRDFVAAIFDVGLKSASPKTILEMMSNSRDLTADHIKSHLQKYRLHRDRARDEFLGNFGRPQSNQSREGPPVAEEVAVDPELSRGLMTRAGTFGAPIGAADLRRGAEQQHSGGGGGEGGSMNAVALIRDCLQMQAGFQQVLKQALASQQQLQAQLQTHMRALGLEPTMVDEGTAGGGGARNRPGSGPQPLAPPMATAGMANMLHTRPGSAAAGSTWGGSKCDAAPHHPIAEEGHVAAFAPAPRHPHPFHPDPLPLHTDHSHNPPSQLPPLPPHPQAQHHGGGGGGGGGGAAPLPSQPPLVTPNMQRRCAEQQMQEEMREHMDMHRQLVQRKNMQVSQYDGGSLTIPVVPGTALAGISAMHRPPPLPPAHQPPPQQPQPQPPVQHSTAGHPMGPSSGPAGAALGMSGGGSAASLLQHSGHPDLVDMDLTGFQWNDDDDHLFNFLMDP